MCLLNRQRLAISSLRKMCDVLRHTGAAAQPRQCSICLRLTDQRRVRFVFSGLHPHAIRNPTRPNVSLRGIVQSWTKREACCRHRFRCRL